MRIPLLVAALMLAQPATAGAWLREKGRGFLSFGTSIDDRGRLEGSVYAEYGLRPKLTLGVKIDAGMTDGLISDGRGYVFLRKPIATGEREFRLAYELGVGGVFGETPVPLLRAGLSYGRGISVWNASGWVALDGAVEWASGSEATTLKLDGTLGLSLSARFQVMLQVFHTQTETESATKLAPSLIWRPRPDGPTRYQLGLEATDEVYAVKLGLWRDF